MCIEQGVPLPGGAGVVHVPMIALTAGGAEVLNQLPLRLWCHRLGG